VSCTAVRAVRTRRVTYVDGVLEGLEPYDPNEIA